MSKPNHEGYSVNRRNFIKTTAIASMAAALPATKILGQTTPKMLRRRRSGDKRKLLFLNEAPQEYGKLIESIKSIREVDLLPVTAANFRSPQEIIKTIKSQDPDIIVLSLPSLGMSSGPMADALENLDVPIILLPRNLDLIMVEADLAGALRMKGVNALLANSEARTIDLIKIVAIPGILEGKRALIFGKPFDSTSVPAHNLSEEYIYNLTGLRMQYRPMEDLQAQYDKISEASAQKEMDRWKKGAIKVVEATDKSILDASRLYVLLRSIVDKEGLAGISIDCLNFSFNRNRTIATPCLAFTRLRDEGVAAPCEADVCGMLSSILLQEISRKPSYFYNISGVNSQNSNIVLRHCVAPLKLLGRDKPELQYSLRDYHGMGGASPEVTFPIGIEVTMGGFTKDLKDFVLWPGRTQPQVMDTHRPSFPNATGETLKMRMFCSNRAEVKIRDIDRFSQNIADIHHTMVAGIYTNALRDEMLKLNVGIIGPYNPEVPEMNKGANASGVKSKA
jgi:L-fucose isomerase-like protein